MVFSVRRIFRFLLLCRTDVLVIVSRSVFNAENDSEVCFTLCLAVFEIFAYTTIQKIEQVLAMPSSTTTQHRIKRTSSSFSASKTEWETIAKTSVLQSSKNRKILGNGDFLIFFHIFRRPPQLGTNTMNISFSRVFERAMWHFNLNFDIKKGPL